MVEQLDNIALYVCEAENDRYPLTATSGDDPIVRKGDSVVAIAAQQGNDVYIPSDDLAAFTEFLRRRDTDARDVEAVSVKNRTKGPSGYGCPACHGGFAPTMHSPVEIAQSIGTTFVEGIARICIHQDCRDRLRVDIEDAYNHSDLLLGDAL